MVEWLNGLAKYVCDAKCFTDDALEFGKNRTGLVCLKMTLVTYSKFAQDACTRQTFQFAVDGARTTSGMANDFIRKKTALSIAKQQTENALLAFRKETVCKRVGR